MCVADGPTACMYNAVRNSSLEATVLYNNTRTRVYFSWVCEAFSRSFRVRCGRALEGERCEVTTAVYYNAAVCQKGAGEMRPAFLAAL